MNDSSFSYVGFGDPKALRQAVFQQTLQAAREFPEIRGPKYTLRLEDVDYEGKDRYSKAEEKKALLANRSLARTLRGTWKLYDTQSGKLVDQQRTPLARVPYVTSWGTFILNGNDFGAVNQLRLRPGIFTRRRESGELESHINVARGLGHSYTLDPESGVFRVEFGSARIPLMPLLQLMGATDSQLREAWGNELYAANVTTDKSTAIKKIYEKLKRPGDGHRGMEDTIKEALSQMELDPEVTKRTLGQPYKKMDLETALATTRKLLQVHRQEAEEDDRDAMVFQRIMRPEDIFAERVRRAQGDVRKMFWRAALSGSLRRVPSMLFDKSIRGALLETGLANSPESINPLELYDQMHRVTRLGEGGIPSMLAVPDSSRAVHPSQFGFIDPLLTPESDRIGIDTRVVWGGKKTADNKLVNRFRDVRTGKMKYLTAQDVADSVVAFPGELATEHEFVRAFNKGQLDYVPRSSVQFELPHFAQAFSAVTNITPFKHTVNPQRASMAARMATQALSLVHAEPQLVQAAVPGTDRTFAELFGPQLGAVHTNVAGHVVAVRPDEIRVKDANGQIHSFELDNNRPYNRKTRIHNTPLVRVGQQVQQGQPLAKSNFTDDQGTAAIGLNARVAYLAMKGLNYEDAIVISESFAKRATSEHVHQYTLDLSEDVKTNKKDFISMFAGKYDKAFLDRYDDNGVLKPGELVQKDEPIILAARRTTVGPRLGRRKPGWKDASVLWDYDTPGEVTDVHVGKHGINVVMKSQQPSKLADKFSGLYGDKGVAIILPDNKMPTNEKGEPFEVLLNPLGIISRGNAGQVFEAILGKVAAKRGKPYRVPDFEDEDAAVAWVSREARKHGVSDRESVYDPETGREIPDVLTGIRYLLKLHHTSESKEQGRATGSYDMEGAPAKGGPTGSKRVGLLEMYALLSNMGFHTLRDIHAIRGQENEDYWRLLSSGYTPSSTREPFVYRKFMAMLQGAGINPVKSGPRTQLMAMTNKAVKELTGDRQIKNAETVDWRSDRLEPIRGGLFDETLTGGVAGERWSYIKLPEPLPNPVMEDGIRALLGLTKKDYEAVLAGEKPLSVADGKMRTGPQAIKEALEQINVPKEIEKAKAAIAGSKKMLRNDAIRKLMYLRGAEKQNQTPADWVLDRAPVLPPVFRPVSILSDSGIPLVNDANYLYKELLDATKNYEEMAKLSSDLAEERKAIYGAFKAVTGLGDPIQPKHQRQRVRGILQQIFSSSPKYGHVQRKLLGSTVDLVGRAAIVPNPNLDMDEVAIPENSAWEIYRPFIMHRLVRSGMPRMQALESVVKREEPARQALLKEMESRPVFVSRAPVLHRFGVIAAYPRLTSGSALEISPIVTGGLGADFDGNCVTGDTEISLVLDLSCLRQSDLGVQFLTCLPYALDSPNELENEVQHVSLILPIHLFPRVGDYQIDRNGARVYPVPDGVFVVTYEHKTSQVRHAPVAYLTVEDEHACVRVTTHGGCVVQVSDNESLAVFNPATGQVEKTAPKDALGKFVPCIKRQPTHGTQFNRDFGWWYGALVADGWLSQGTVGYANADDACRREFERIAREQLAYQGDCREHAEAQRPGKYAASVKLHLDSKAFCRRLLDIYVAHDDLAGRGALYKVLPQEILYQGSRECLLGVLSGLLDGERTLGWNHATKTPRYTCKFNASSVAFRDSILQLLRYLGVRANVTTRPARGKAQKSYIISPSLNDMCTLLPELTVVRQRSQDWVKHFLQHPPQQDVYNCKPVTTALCQALADFFLANKSLDENQTLHAAMRQALKRGYIDSTTARQVHRIVGEQFDHADWPLFLQMLMTDDVYWDQVQSVELIEAQPVFDLAVPGTQVFMLANGLIVYDTMQFHVPADPDAVKEMTEKLLPSRNLFGPQRFDVQYKPSMEYLGGLWYATNRKSTSSPKVYRSRKEVLEAYRRGELRADQEVHVLER